MATLQNLVLKDRQATPVDHTFVPLRLEAGNKGIVAEGSGTLVGNNTVSVMNSESAGRNKTRIRYVFPVVQTETINGISRPKVVRQAYVDIVFDFSKESLEAERNNVQGMVESSLGVTKTLVYNSVVKLEGVWG